LIFILQLSQWRTVQQTSNKHHIHYLWPCHGGEYDYINIRMDSPCLFGELYKSALFISNRIFFLKIFFYFFLCLSWHKPLCICWPMFNRGNNRQICYDLHECSEVAGREWLQLVALLSLDYLCMRFLTASSLRLLNFCVIHRRVFFFKPTAWKYCPSTVCSVYSYMEYKE